MLTTITTLALISTWCIIFTEYAKEFIQSAWVFKLKGIHKIKKPILTILEVKPFNCCTCLTLWACITFGLIFDTNFIYLSAPCVVITHAIKRHLILPF